MVVGNWGIFDGLRSWIKNGRNMKGVGKCGGRMGKCFGMWGGAGYVGKYGGVVEECMG